MKKYCFLALLLIPVWGCSQQRVTLIVDSLPKKTGVKYFLAGNFNMWNPGDTSFRFHIEKNRYVISISLPKGHYEYKITRGNWQTVEEHADFKPMDNRILDLQSDSTIHLKIEAWADDRPGRNAMVTHSTTTQVHIMDTAFYMPQLHRARRIWIYLPKGYSTSKKRYSVLYMHDGQNVFDAATSYSGEWGVDEFLDSLKQSCKKVIVVAIDNGLSKRMNEYNPWEFMNFGKGEGDAYVDFLIKTLKPYIDKNYRTLPGQSNTSIAGSSMGGLISLYAVLKYPKTFGSAGIFSPAFWTASGIDSTVLSDALGLNTKLYFYAGGKEGESMVPDMLRIIKEIRSRGKTPIKQAIDPDAKHNENAWRKHFPEFYKWVFCR